MKLPATLGNATRHCCWLTASLHADIFVNDTLLMTQVTWPWLVNTTLDLLFKGVRVSEMLLLTKI
jgi:hypothetical protein